MRILGLDIETGGNFDAPIEKNFITEIGCVLWDTELQEPVKIFSALIKDGPESSKEAIEYTGITNEMRQEYGVELGVAIFKLVELMSDADFIMAHNGETFDKPIVLNAVKKFMPNGFPTTAADIWIDSLIDVDYPAKYKSTNLTYLKGAKEITVPGHRAVFDVLAMLKINLTITEPSDIKNDELRKRYEDLMQACLLDNISQMVDSAESPIVTVRACVTFQDLAGREAAKKEKFHWEPQSKLWVRQIRKAKLDKVQWPFQWQILEKK